MLGMLDGRMAKLGMLQPMVSTTAMPMRPLEPGSKPQRVASAMPAGMSATARPTEDGIRKPRNMAISINPPMRRR